MGSDLSRAQLLFLVVLGGRHGTSLIEQHDVRFVAGKHIAYNNPNHRRTWLGRRGRLHQACTMPAPAV